MATVRLPILCCSEHVRANQELCGSALTVYEGWWDLPIRTMQLHPSPKSWHRIKLGMESWLRRFWHIWIGKTRFSLACLCYYSHTRSVRSPPAGARGASSARADDRRWRQQRSTRSAAQRPSPWTCAPVGFLLFLCSLCQEFGYVLLWMWRCKECHNYFYPNCVPVLTEN